MTLIDAMGAHGSALISSFNHEYLLKIKRLNSEIHTGVLVSSPPDDVLGLMRPVFQQNKKVDFASILEEKSRAGTVNAEDPRNGSASE